MGEFRYGDNHTIHGSTLVDVEVDADGRVVAVWFRCHPVPFHQSPASDNRAKEMRAMYDRGKSDPLKIKAIVFDAPDKTE